MGTRSTIHIVDGKTTLARLYVQFDGNPTGVGARIKEILGGKKMVNGYNDAATQINGAGCMAAMLIAGLKGGCGGVYVVDPSCDECEEYAYTVTGLGAGAPIGLQVVGLGSEMYLGTLDDFEPGEVERQARATA